jgi:hypothetical protein
MMLRFQILVGRALVWLLNRHGLDVVPLLRWSRTPPSAPGFYWVRAPQISPRVEKFYEAAQGMRSTDFYAEWIHGKPVEYAGPILKPEERE